MLKSEKEKNGLSLSGSVLCNEILSALCSSFCTWLEGRMRIGRCRMSSSLCVTMHLSVFVCVCMCLEKVLEFGWIFLKLVRRDRKWPPCNKAYVCVYYTLCQGILASVWALISSPLCVQINYFYFHKIQIKISLAQRITIQVRILHGLVNKPDTISSGQLLRGKSLSEPGLLEE